ncbi:MAG: helix-turn-helix domain-containing protein [Pelagimonas sp.]|uniref:helix-turn-helix domain-containing protein n=1 Tax=Pelagimonas sp. TaxID=2073170 RepID=UPI003D6B4E25
MSNQPEFYIIGKRLEAIRLGFSEPSQKAWAEKHGFGATQYNNWEKGSRRIPVEAAEKLCDTYGLTLDAIYRGRLDGLSEKLMNML